MHAMVYRGPYRVRVEVTHHSVSSRLGHNRADVKHQWMDPIIVGAPWVGAGTGVYLAVRRLARRR